MRVEKRRGGVEVSVTPALGWKTGLDNDYLYSEDTIWQLDRAESARMRPALEALCGKSLFFTTGDATAFCSYVLPELGSRVTIEDPERLLLNQIPLEPVVQFYLDAPTRETVRAHLEFLYGEDRVTPEKPGPAGLLRDARAEQRAGRLLGRYLEPGPDTINLGRTAGRVYAARWLEHPMMICPLEQSVMSFSCRFRSSLSSSIFFAVA